MAELLTETSTGLHNSNLDLARGRIIEGGTWKQQRVIVIWPAGKSVPSDVVQSWLNIVYPPNQAVFRICAKGMEVGEAYSQAIQEVVQHPELSKWEWILTIEHDNMPPPTGLLKLIKRMEERPDLSCIGGLYWTKGEGGVPQIWGDVNDPVLNWRPQAPVPGEVVECCGTGMGFNLWRLSMFKDERLRRPWFKTITGIEGTGTGTQDLYFWGDARKHGYRCGVDCDVLVAHFDPNTGIPW